MYILSHANRLPGTKKENAVNQSAHPSARVSMMIRAAPADIVDAFVQPGQLARFWLASASAPLRVGSKVHWNFMVPGAEVDTCATSIDPDKGIAWDWSDGTHVAIGLEPLGDGATAVTLDHTGFQGGRDAMAAAALDATEGFALVLADLKTLLESGVSANLVRDKARLISLRQLPR